MRKLVAVALVVMMAMSLAAFAVAEESAAQKFTVWCWDDNVEAIQRAADMYNANAGTNIELEVVFVANEDSRTKLITIGASGDYSSLPDILLMEDTCVSQFVSTYPDMFVDMTDMGVAWDELVPSKRQLFTVNDGYYAIPMDSGASIALYRTDYLEEADYTIADLTDITWDELMVIGQQVYETTGHKLLVDNTYNMFTVKQIYTSAGGQFFDEEGNCTFNNDIMAKALQTLKDLVDNNCIYIAGSWDEYIACMNNGSAAGVVNGNWVNGNIADAEGQEGLWAVTDMPVLDGVDGATHYTNSGGASWVVTTHCPDAEAAVAFLAGELCGEYAQEYWEDLTTYTGYLSTYYPVLNSGLYESLTHVYFGDGFYGEIAKCVPNAPALNSSPYYQEAVDQLIAASANVVAGADITAEMENAQAAIEFAMGR